MKCSPDNITHLEPNQVFTFGSNLAGKHGKGAALTAVRKFGARNGVGTGIQGQSYGIATKDKNFKVLSEGEIYVQVHRFIRYAISHPELDFLVTEIGCGLAGYRPKEIAPMFRDAINLPNVFLPKRFIQILNP